MAITADETAAGPSTPTPTAKRTRAAMKQTGKSRTATPVTGGRGGITQGVSFEFFESFLLIYSHNTHWVNFEFF